MLNIYCFKWGSKYDFRYPNRLLGALRKHCHTPFTLSCLTDNPDGIHKDIEIMPLPYSWPSPIFTSEKIELMGTVKTEKNLILDLDILIHDDITELVTRPIERPVFIYTHWTPEWQWKNVPQKTACFVNSSFVRWDAGMADYIWKYLSTNFEEMAANYNSCDKFLFYEFALSSKPKNFNSFDYWEEGIFYNYNQEGKYRYQFREDHKVCLFNTSHLIKMGRTYYELESTPDWSADLWESYDIL